MGCQAALTKVKRKPVTVFTKEALTLFTLEYTTADPKVTKDRIIQLCKSAAANEVGVTEEMWTPVLNWFRNKDRRSKQSNTSTSTIDNAPTDLGAPIE